ncbi:MAG: class I mannose-6-phosphate isomerase [Oscillospiraceae bacterium]|nr:class I mannose-6-phosphate isomerase [Oscillospiraceae bacterium]
MDPYKLTPVYQDYLWGGERLKARYNKTGAAGIIAESWELSARPGASATIATGSLSGMDFFEFTRRYPALCGMDAHDADASEFPLLIKLIDAQQALSVQVHPGDGYARDPGGLGAGTGTGASTSTVTGAPGVLGASHRGKTEMWVILECEPGAFLYHGFSRAVTAQEVAARAADGTITDVLRAVQVHPGDVFFIPAGVIHAIGAGIVIAEIQQNSDSTFRVFDYGRTDKHGNPRELHLSQALDVLRLDSGAPAPPGAGLLAKHPSYTLTQLALCPYFDVKHLRLNGGAYRQRGGPFAHLLCIGGGGTLTAGTDTGADDAALPAVNAMPVTSALNITQGDSVFVPAGPDGFSLSGDGTFLITAPG